MPRPTRIFIACTQCKTRKVRCDGVTPQCTNCTARGADCVYAAARQYRGKGKKTKSKEVAEEDILATQQIDQQTGQPPPHSSTPPPSSGIPVSLLDAAAQILRQQRQYNNTNGDNASSSSFPAFLLPGNFESHMTQVQSSVAVANNSTTPFTPMMPLQIAKRLLQNSYEEMRLGLPFLSELAEILSLLDDLFGPTSSPIPPASSAPAFALVNAVVALAIRHKTAVGSEPQIASVATAYYRNATLVTHHLILQTPTPMSVQALKAMAAFAGGKPDPSAQAMLLSNAEQQERIMAAG